MAFRLATALLILASTGCASLGPLNPLAGIERSVLFHPTPVDTVRSGADFESVKIRVSNDQQIHGLLLEHDAPRGVLLFCHGNAGNVMDRLRRLRKLRATHDLTVFSFDYRGYGASDGKPGEKTIYEDARAARQWLSERTEVAEADIILMGRSLGGAVAVELATDGAKGLILESTFSSIADVARSHIKLLPVSLMLTQRFDSRSKIRKYDGPLLQVHGTADRVVPYQSGEKLFDAANGSKLLITDTGAGHNSEPGSEYQQELLRFTRQLTDSFGCGTNESPSTAP